MALSEVRCGCGALVPEEAGPTHAYMRSAPGCWRMYTNLTAQWLGGHRSDLLVFSHVDCYAVQHPGGAETDRRQRQSVAVHLIALDLAQVHQVQGAALSRMRQRVSATVLSKAGLADWPFLTPPAAMGAVVAADLHRASALERVGLVERWRAEAWLAWSEHHEVVDEWARLLLSPRSRLL